MDVNRDKTIAIVATLDTKAPETAYLKCIVSRVFRE